MYLAHSEQGVRGSAYFRVDLLYLLRSILLAYNLFGRQVGGVARPFRGPCCLASKEALKAKDWKGTGDVSVGIAWLHVSSIGLVVPIALYGPLSLLFLFEI